MKNARKLLALVLFTTLFFSCTTDEIYEEHPTLETPSELADFSARDGDTGGDEQNEPDPPEDD